MRSKNLITLAIAFGLVAFGLAGCGDESGTGIDTGATAESDEAAIGMIISEDLDNFGFGTEMDESAVAVGNIDGKVSLEGAPIESFFFARLARVVHRSADVQIEQPAGEPPVATVTVTHQLEGIFRLFYDDVGSIYLPGSIDKPLSDTATRRAVFVKRGGHERHRGWKLVEISGTELISNPSTKVIQSVEISSASVNMVITDPLELWPLPEVPTFLPGEEVTLTVTTGDETDFVFLHWPGGKDDFTPLGGGVFEGTWTTGPQEGRRRVAIDVIDEDTLFDDEAPYDSAAWGFPYRIAEYVDPNGS
jgi:hypothetical protein